LIIDPEKGYTIFKSCVMKDLVQIEYTKSHSPKVLYTQSGKEDAPSKDGSYSNSHLWLKKSRLDVLSWNVILLSFVPILQIIQLDSMFWSALWTDLRIMFSRLLISTNIGVIFVFTILYNIYDSNFSDLVANI
jgi:hypothetical protein